MRSNINLLLFSNGGFLAAENSADSLYFVDFLRTRSLLVLNSAETADSERPEDILSSSLQCSAF